MYNLFGLCNYESVKINEIAKKIVKQKEVISLR